MALHIHEVLVSDIPLPAPDHVVVLDVREDDEWAAGHVDGALHIPLLELPGRLDELPHDCQLVAICKVGARSAQATVFLQHKGFDAVNVSGGMMSWDAAGLPMVAESDSTPFVA